MSLIVYLQESAFQAMLISSIETFPSSYFPPEPGKKKTVKDNPHDGEATGLLFGQRVVKGEHLVFNVNLAVTMQATQRRADGVAYSNFHFERIREITESFPHMEFLGGFHSHPWGKNDFGRTATEPSEADIENSLEAAQNYGDELLEIIVGITVLSRNSYRDARSDKNSIDSSLGRYKYRISAYCTVGSVVENESDIDRSLKDSSDCDEAGLLPVDQLVCPLAAVGGNIFN